MAIDDSDHSNGSPDPLTGAFHWDVLALSVNDGESVSVTADNDGWYYIGTGTTAALSSYGMFHTTITINGALLNTTIFNDARHILEGQASIEGNVFTNNALPEDEMTIKPGSLTSANGNVADANGVIQGKYGQLTLNSDGTYTYQLTKDMNYLGAGVDLHDEQFTYTVEWHELDQQGNVVDHHKDNVELKIDIHGTNDASVVADVNVRTFEGGDHVGATAPFYTGQLKLEDVNPTVTGVQTDLDNGDTHTFAVDNGTVTITSTDLTAAQIAAIKPTVNIGLNSTTGSYTVTGDFDALSVGDEATISFEYWSVDRSVGEDGIAGNADDGITQGAHKTATITVVGQNDRVELRNDTIVTYDQLIDGDIYKSILANDGHYDPIGGTTMPGDIDVHDTLEIASTGFHDLQFYNEGGQITVDNAARMLQYTPGTGGAIAKDHFSFYYQATDGYTDPIGSALAEFKMVNGNIGAGAVPLYGTNNPIVQVDFYQFGDNSDNTINGIKGKSNVLSGMGGDDYIEGKKEADILYGGDGDDILQGGWGNDIYKGGKGTDGIVDTRGNDLYVFSKGDGRDTIDDTSLEIYTDAMGHEIINENYIHQLTEDYFYAFYDSAGDVVRFDKSVDISKIAIFQEDDQYGSLLIKYSENADDKVSVGWQQEDHYGIERIQAYDANGQLLMIDTRSDENGTYGQMHRPKQFDTDLDGTIDATYDELIAYIASYDLDGDITNGVQAAQNVQDVQNNEHLMAVIATGWHYKPF